MRNPLVYVKSWVPNLIFYLGIFLAVFTYVLLIKTPVNPTYLEWYLLVYIIGFGMEIFRKVVSLNISFLCIIKAIKESIFSCSCLIRKSFERNCHSFSSTIGTHWLLLPFSYLLLASFYGYILRQGFYTHKYWSNICVLFRSAGRVVLAIDSMLWSIKLLDFLSVHPRFGPYVTIASKMIMSMVNIVVLLMISLLAFGLTRQSITYPNEEWSWLLLRNVFYKPYFMLYGEVYADEIGMSFEVRFLCARNFKVIFTQ